jgi:diketogulonate reductase-like aldo/keto reductase
VKNIPEASGEWICLICAAVLDSYVQRRSKNRKETYHTLEKLLEKLLENGTTRSIGVSNWDIGHIEELV